VSAILTKLLSELKSKEQERKVKHRNDIIKKNCGYIEYAITHIYISSDKELTRELVPDNVREVLDCVNNIFSEIDKREFPPLDDYDCKLSDLKQLAERIIKHLESDYLTYDEITISSYLHYFRAIVEEILDFAHEAEQYFNEG